MTAVPGSPSKAPISKSNEARAQQRPELCRTSEGARGDTSRPLYGKSAAVHVTAVQASESDPDLWLYRERTMGILRRYQRMSVEVGRLPSLLGREFFRTQVTSYRTGTFEDAVIFVHDVARGLEQLGDFEHQLIARIALQDYTQNEAARLLGCWRRTVGRRFPEALDRMSEIFLTAGLHCQEGKIEQIPASASVHGE